MRMDSSVHATVLARLIHAPNAGHRTFNVELFELTYRVIWFWPTTFIFLNETLIDKWIIQEISGLHKHFLNSDLPSNFVPYNIVSVSICLISRPTSPPPPITSCFPNRFLYNSSLYGVEFNHLLNHCILLGLSIIPLHYFLYPLSDFSFTFLNQFSLTHPRNLGIFMI